MTALIPPTVNLNGTSGLDLFKQADDVCAALHDLRLAMGRAMPHGRDYQTSDMHACYKAREAHIERAVILDQIEKDYLGLREAIFKQLPEKEWRGIELAQRKG